MLVKSWYQFCFWGRQSVVEVKEDFDEALTPFFLRCPSSSPTPPSTPTQKNLLTLYFLISTEEGAVVSKDEEKS